MATNQSARKPRRKVDAALIKEIRLNRELTVPAAAALIGCHPSHLDGIEQERWGASEIMLRKIARAYRVRLDEICIGEVSAA